MAGKSVSKDADKLICLLYKSYLQRRKEGKTKDSCRYFGASNELQQSTFPNILVEDVTSNCWELHRFGYLRCCPGDDLANDIILTDDAIVYMENRFINGVSDVAKFISNFIP